MQWLFDIVAGAVAALAVAILGQFGLDAVSPAKPDREVRRIKDDCRPAPSNLITVAAERERGC